MTLRTFVFAMDVVPPPLSAEDCQENHRAGDLSDNSTQQCAANNSWKQRDCCGDQRWSNVAPRILPVKDPSQRRIAEDALDDIRQQNTDRPAQCSISWNEPQKSGSRDRTCDHRMQKIQMRPLHHDHRFAQRNKRIDRTGEGHNAQPNDRLAKTPDRKCNRIVLPASDITATSGNKIQSIH